MRTRKLVPSKLLFIIETMVIMNVDVNVFSNNMGKEKSVQL